MFWKVAAGYSQPSPIEQILDKDEFTLEDLLNEEDLIQECKSLNGRLVAFLRERSTVEQLIRYMVEPATDFDDPKRAFKYPFTACEVFCCEVEAVFNTLLDDPELMALLFSLLDQEPPLSSKTAGYFGRLVGHLLLRKTSEVMQYLQEHAVILEKMVRHADTSSIADILKRIVGADEQASMLCAPAYAQWLSEASLIDLLLSGLAPDNHPDLQANAADILSAIAHTQPNPLASKLMRQDCINALFLHAMGSSAAPSPGISRASSGPPSPSDQPADPAPGPASPPSTSAAARPVLVHALDVAIALVNPRRSSEPDHGLSMGGSIDSPLPGPSMLVEASRSARFEAIASIVRHLPAVVEVMRDTQALRSQETPFGLLTPALGRARLKCVELVAVLVRSGEPGVGGPAEQPLIDSGALPLCLELMQAYPFNNVLHHHVTSALLSIITRRPVPGYLPRDSISSLSGTVSGDSLHAAHSLPTLVSFPLLRHLFEQCAILDWVVNLPSQVRPTPRPGQEANAAAKQPLRAGYLGHLTHIAATLEEMGGNLSSLPPGEMAQCVSTAAAAAGGADEGVSGVSGGGVAAEGSTLSPIGRYIALHAAWRTWYTTVLMPRQALENTSRWECGRPVPPEIGGADSDNEEYQNYFIKDLSSDSDAAQGSGEAAAGDASGLQPALYHRYSDEDDQNEDEDADNDDDDDDDDDDDGGGGYHLNDAILNPTHIVTEALSAMNIHDSGPLPGYMDVDRSPGYADESEGVALAGAAMADDQDAVLLAASDDEAEGPASSSPLSPQALQQQQQQQELEDAEMAAAAAAAASALSGLPGVIGLAAERPQAFDPSLTDATMTSSEDGDLEVDEQDVHLGEEGAAVALGEEGGAGSGGGSPPRLGGPPPGLPAAGDGVELPAGPPAPPSPTMSPPAGSPSSSAQSPSSSLPASTAADNVPLAGAASDAGATLHAAAGSGDGSAAPWQPTWPEAVPEAAS